MTEIRISSNVFTGVPFPVVLGDRYFHIFEDPDGRLKVDVFRWSEALGLATYEVRNNEALTGAIDSSPNGNVVFTGEDGGFQYKFRPKSKSSQMFGTIPLGDELRVVLNDRSLCVYRGTELVVNANQNTFGNVAIGVWVKFDGSVVMGVAEPPRGMVVVAA